MMRPYRNVVRGTIIPIKTPKSTSKLLLWVITATYFIGIILGTIIIGAVIASLVDNITHVTDIVDLVSAVTQLLIALFSYVGGVVAITIPFYIWKAKNENVQKGTICKHCGNTQFDEINREEY